MEKKKIGSLPVNCTVDWGPFYSPAYFVSDEIILLEYLGNDPRRISNSFQSKYRGTISNYLTISNSGRI